MDGHWLAHFRWNRSVVAGCVVHLRISLFASPGLSWQDEQAEFSEFKQCNMRVFGHRIQRPRSSLSTLSAEFVSCGIETFTNSPWRNPPSLEESVLTDSKRRQVLGQEGRACFYGVRDGQKKRSHVFAQSCSLPLQIRHRFAKRCRAWPLPFGANRLLKPATHG